MRTILYPERQSWKLLCKRPTLDRSGLKTTVGSILERVKKEGDKALISLSEEIDGVSPGSLKVGQAEIEAASVYVPASLKDAILVAKSNIEKFHRAQLKKELVIETTEGVKCWRRSLPVENAGLYVPGGTAPLFSTVLMLAIPSALAGCRNITMCTPPGKDGKVNPVILYAASISGVTEIFKIGGAQAIAAMAYGTESVPAADKIFGPGNQYVTMAKELIQLDGVAIDMPAGPSEVLVIADRMADPSFIASDLLSQAEHGADSQVLLITDDLKLLENTRLEIEKQAAQLPRKEIVSGALENSSLILLRSIEECMDFSNLYAPEHLIISTRGHKDLADKVLNAGSVFLGKYSCESAGDYASGTNHTLPTSGFARSFSGVSVDSFMKKITIQEISAAGLKNLGPVIEIMAEAESLLAHKNAVTIRLKSIENG